MKKNLIRFHLLVILALSSLTACSNRGNEEPLLGTHWFLVSLNSHALIPGTTISARFDQFSSGTYMAGNVLCNHYEVPASWDDHNMRFPKDPAVTLLLCGETKDNLEEHDEYIETLPQVTSYQIKDNQLEMKNKGGDQVLVFQKDFLMESRWTLESLNGQELLPDPVVTAKFFDYQETSYIGGCAAGNSYTFEAVWDNQMLILHPIPNDINVRESCATQEKQWEHEDEYYRTLQEAASYQITGDRLEVKNEAGEIVLVFRRDR